jgi:allose kinase
VVQERYPETPIGRAFAELADTPEIVEVLEAMAIAVAAEANIIDPDEVIIGGGLPLMEGFDREAFGRRVYTHLRKPYPAETLELRYSRQGQLSGLIGGAIRLSR